MPTLKLKKGTKLQMAFDAGVGKEPAFDMVCTFYKELDESAFLASVPMYNGKPLPLDEARKLLFRYDDNGQPILIGGYADDAVQEGIRRYWKIRRTEQRQMFRRSDERIKIALHTQYMQSTWRANSEGVIEKEDALSLDISNGGIAMFVPQHFEVGEICQTTLPKVGTSPNGNTIENVVGVVCWCREAPKGSPFRFICGLQFRFADTNEKDDMMRYVANIKRRSAL